MIQQSTFDFLKALKKNNDREWFDKNRNKYENAKADFEQFVGLILKSLVKVNPALGSLEVKHCVFRIYRDVRFSKNKAPYKTNMGAWIVEGGKKSEKAGIYIQAESGNCMVAGGCWMPQAPVLKAIRQEIDYNFKDFKKIVEANSFKKYFGTLSDTKLKTTPKGYDADNPAIDFLRQTSFVVTAQLHDKDFTTKSIVKECTDIYKSMKPFLDFLNRAQD